MSNPRDWRHIGAGQIITADNTVVGTCDFLPRDRDRMIGAINSTGAALDVLRLVAYELDKLAPVTVRVDGGEYEPLRQIVSRALIRLAATA